MCGSMADIQSAAAEIRRGKKRRTNHSMKIYMVSLFHRATINYRMRADSQRDDRPAEYRWRPLRKFRNSIPCTTPQSLNRFRAFARVNQCVLLKENKIWIMMNNCVTYRLSRTPLVNSMCIIRHGF